MGNMFATGQVSPSHWPKPASSPGFLRNLGWNYFFATWAGAVPVLSE